MTLKREEFGVEAELAAAESDGADSRQPPLTLESRAADLRIYIPTA
jgi:hypothetical protein